MTDAPDTNRPERPIADRKILRGGPVQRRLLSTFAATGLGLALAVSIAPSSLAAESSAGLVQGGATLGSLQKSVPDAVVSDPCRTIDFEKAEVTPIASTDPLRPVPRYRLTVSGTKSASDVVVRLLPVKHVEQPRFWGVVVVGCPSGIGLPVLMPYTATYDFNWTMGTCGIEVIGATRNQQIDLAGCRPIPLAGTKWVLDSSGLGVPVPDGTTVTANFSETTMSGSTSCNSYVAKYSVDENGAFKIGAIAMTARVCDPEIGKIESVFLSRLTATTQLQATRTELRLRGDGQILLRFTPAPAT
jgi:heat shock protein HslJ